MYVPILLKIKTQILLYQNYLGCKIQLTFHDFTIKTP